MNLYFQFLTQKQGVEAAGLIRAIASIASVQRIKGRTKVRAQASVSRSSFSDLEALVAKMKAKRFNQLEVMPEIPWLDIGETRARAVVRKAEFTPSPTCALWLPTKEWKIDATRACRNEYMSAKSSEKVVVANHVKRQPTVFELSLEIRTKISKERILEECAHRLAKTATELFGELEPFGCCDFVEPVFIPQLKRSILMPEVFQVMMNVKPPEYSKLGDRLDALHPLMFGSKRLCERMKAAVPKDARLIKASRLGDFAVVRLAPTCDVNAVRFAGATG